MLMAAFFVKETKHANYILIFTSFHEYNSLPPLLGGAKAY